MTLTTYRLSIIGSLYILYILFDIFRVVTYFINNFYTICCLFYFLLDCVSSPHECFRPFIHNSGTMLATGESTTQNCCTSQLHTHIRSLSHFRTNTQVLYLGSFTHTHTLQNPFSSPPNPNSPPPPPHLSSPPPSISTLFLPQVPRDFTTQSHNFLLKTPLQNNTFNSKATSSQKLLLHEVNTKNRIFPYFPK